MYTKISLKLNNIFLLLSYLRDIVIFKTNGRSWTRQVTIKAKDLYMLKNNVSHGDLVRFGYLLALLAKHGLAIKVNKQRPMRWILKRPVIEWAYFCDLKCRIDPSTCSLRDICPYHILLGEGNGSFN